MHEQLFLDLEHDIDIVINLEENASSPGNLFKSTEFRNALAIAVDHILICSKEVTLISNCTGNVGHIQDQIQKYLDLISTKKLNFQVSVNDIGSLGKNIKITGKKTGE